MGGNIFDNSKRIEQEDYEKLISICRDKFQSIQRNTHFPESFLSKKDHGDLDVIVCGPVVPKEELKELFGLEDDQISQNTTVISIFYERKYQVDFAFHPVENFISAYSYNRNGDCCNLVGRLAHHIGLSLGHDGLSYHVNLNDCDRLGKVSISRDFSKIIPFFGLNYEHWETGFENAEELFEWIVKSPYFNPDVYQFENLNHVNRVRNRKRPVFAGFVEWLNGREFPNKFVPGKNKAEYLWQTLLYFERTDILTEIGTLIARAGQKKKANQIFNGATIMEIAGLKGAELGKVLGAFRKDCVGDSEELWDRMRLYYGEGKMKSHFKNFWRFAKNVL